MEVNYSRLLRDDDSVEHFLVDVLQVDQRISPAIIRKIVTSEKMLMDFKDEENTLVSTKYRDRDYVNNVDRWKLRKQIIHELFTLKRRDNEDEIKLGTGGALPASGIRKDRKAYILIGPPASGKSTVANKIAEKEGAIILDSDYAKRKFPEFEYECGATLVQKESNNIIFGFKNDNPLKLEGVCKLAVNEAYNVVIPKVGQEPDKIVKLAEFLAETNYEVHLTLLYLKRREATIRALHRFNETNRYVPLGYVFDNVGNDPLLCYYVLKERADTCFRSFGMIMTDPDMQKNKRRIDLDVANPACWYNVG
ncbi:zeta toxin family protein [Chitinophaga filiformis]|uniref:zeta toxin family protein n=1 Tax=Chitinophaga filiformis TaxID=104663 RepID=UPI001F2E3EDD|nr:zeta toxin family protein [Chitinophaga filiformis]MCF6406903.1 zeta toxin family protein [Chitinophaga filiformis]